MKQKVTILLILMLAGLVFYGGAGVNIISYCCNHCRVAGIEAIIENQCCELHDHDHSVQKANQMLYVDGCTTECGMERLYFDWTSVQSLFPNLQPAVFDLWFAKALNISLLPELQIKDLLSVTSIGPPVNCPRLYLSILTILLI